MLERDAARLSAGRPLPLDLDALLRELGITLAAEIPSAGSRGAHGSLRRLGSVWEIVVDSGHAPARQRSTAAHELGHYLIEARVGYRPTTAAAYWTLEGLCQKFAASLLAPAGVVDGALKPRPQEASGLLSAVDRLIAMTGLSLEAASRRVVDEFEGSALLAAAEPRGGGGRDAGRLVWLYSSGRPLAYAARGQRLSRSHPLHAAVLVGRGIGVGHAAAAKLDGLPVHVMRRTEDLVLLGALG